MKFRARTFFTPRWKQLLPLALALIAVVAASQVSAALDAEVAAQTNKFAHEQSPVETVDELILKDQKRNKELPLKIYFPQTGVNYPVIVYSHGAGGSKDNYGPLGSDWASHGYVVIHTTHEDSIALQRAAGKVTAADAQGLQQMLLRMAGEPQAWESRARDVALVMDSLKEIEQRAPRLKGKLDRTRIGVGGHSFGAYTSQLLGGATIEIGGQTRSFLDPRPQAFLLLSPQGSGQQGLTKKSWEKFTRPLLVATGSNDRGATGQTPAQKAEAFTLSPAGDKYLVFLEGAYHNLGGISGAQGGGLRLGPESAEQVSYLRTASLAFWNAYLKQDKQAKSWLQSDALQQTSNGAARVTHR
ncbi:MAG: alpha/beta hydrolase family protein [Blastocatellia bacterium]